MGVVLKIKQGGGGKPQVFWQPCFHLPGQAILVPGF